MSEAGQTTLLNVNILEVHHPKLRPAGPSEPLRGIFLLSRIALAVTDEEFSTLQLELA